MTTPDVAAHTQAEAHHYVVHFPPHPARTSDPHYADFNAYHQHTRHTARCYVGQRIGYSDCLDAHGKPCPPPDTTGEQPGPFSLQKYKSPSGRTYTARQVRAYYATAGWRRKPRKKKQT